MFLLQTSTPVSLKAKDLRFSHRAEVSMKGGLQNTCCSSQLFDLVERYVVLSPRAPAPDIYSKLRRATFYVSALRVHASPPRQNHLSHKLFLVTWRDNEQRLSNGCYSEGLSYHVAHQKKLKAFPT